MDQVGPGPGTDHSLDGHRAVCLPELLDATPSSQPVDRGVDVLFRLSGGVNRIGGKAAHAFFADGVAGVYRHQRTVHVLGQLPTVPSSAQLPRADAGNGADDHLELLRGVSGWRRAVAYAAGVSVVGRGGRLRRRTVYPRPAAVARQPDSWRWFLSVGSAFDRISVGERLANVDGRHVPGVGDFGAANRAGHGRRR